MGADSALKLFSANTRGKKHSAKGEKERRSLHWVQFSYLKNRSCCEEERMVNIVKETY